MLVMKRILFSFVSIVYSLTIFYPITYVTDQYNNIVNDNSKNVSAQKNEVITDKRDRYIVITINYNCNLYLNIVIFELW